jgi:flavin-dependent dehydrogenase
VNQSHTFDVIVVGGGPAGATAAHDLAQRGHSVLLLDRDGRTKPCGGAIPPRLIKDFAIPDTCWWRARCARMVSPSDSGGHPDRRRLCRHGRPRHLRRMAARTRRLGRRGAPARPFRPALARDDRRHRVVHFHTRGRGPAKPMCLGKCARGV